MKLKVRFDGSLLMKGNAAEDDACHFTASQPVNKGQIVEVKTETARLCSQSLWAYVKAGKVAPVDDDAKAFFESK